MTEIFKGVCTALITPFSDNKVDYDALGRLIDYQLEGGVRALAVCGTTGEAPTLSEEEIRGIIEFSVKRVNNRAKIIAGAGSNDTAHAARLTALSCKAGAHAVLSVTPYYNKTTQEGIVAHYTEIANASDVPVIVYNVPSRTGLDIAPETYKKLSLIKNIGGIKEANPDAAKLCATLYELKGALPVYSGCDEVNVPFMSMGCSGTISVLSNILPAVCVQLMDYCLKGDYVNAPVIQKRLTPLIKGLFSRVNPICVKYAAAHLGLCENEVRLPLVAAKKEDIPGFNGYVDTELIFENMLKLQSSSKDFLGSDGVL